MRGISQFTRKATILKGASNTIPTERDVRLIRLDQSSVLAVSCDSSGAIGSKPLDQVKCPPYTVGRFAARAALMEILALGAVPVCIATPLAVEPTPTGRGIIRGIRSEMKMAGLDPQTPFIDSTEKNVKVRQTGVGVTAIGLAHADSLKVGCCVDGDEIFTIGLPHVGTEVLAGQRRHAIADTRDVCKLIQSDFIREIIPVGSRGILHEATVIARDSKLRFELDRDIQIDLSKSAGPATVILFARGKSRRAITRISKPVRHVGTLVD